MEKVTIAREDKTLALSIDPAIADDMELFEDLTALDAGEYKHLPRLIERILGAEQKTALYDFLRNDAGRVPMEPVMTAVAEIFEQIQNGKK